MFRKIWEIIKVEYRKIPDPHKVCVIGTFIGVPIFGCLTAFALALELEFFEFLGDKYKKLQMYLLICTCGWASGWFTGVLYTPQSETEDIKAKKTYNFIATFASGFLIGVVTPFIKEATSKSDTMFLCLKGFLFFLTAFLTTLLIIIVIRRYYEKPLIEKSKKEEEDKKANSIQSINVKEIRIQR